MSRDVYMRARLAARTTTATVLACVLGLAPATEDLITVKFLVPVLAIFAVQRTLGQTLHSSFLLLKGALIGALVTVPLLLLLPRAPAVLFALLVLLSAVAAALITTPPVAKLALAFIVLQCTLALGDATTPVRLAADLLVAVLVAVLCACTALLLPRPHSARGAIVHEAAAGFEACAVALPLLAAAFAAADEAARRMALGRARHTLARAVRGCERAASLVAFVAWEPSPHARRATLPYLDVLCQGLLAQLRSLDEMRSALARVDHSPTHAEYVRRLAPAIKETCQRASDLMNACAAATKEGRPLPLADVHGVEAALHRLSVDFRRARQALLFNVHEGSGGDTPAGETVATASASDDAALRRILVEEIGARLGPQAAAAVGAGTAAGPPVGEGAPGAGDPLPSAVIAALDVLPVRPGATESLRFTITAKPKLAHFMFSLGNFVRALLHLPHAPPSALHREGGGARGELALSRPPSVEAEVCRLVDADRCGARARAPSPSAPPPPSLPERGDLEAAPVDVPPTAESPDARGAGGTAEGGAEAVAAGFSPLGPTPSFPFPTEAPPAHALSGSRGGAPAPRRQPAAPLWRRWGAAGAAALAAAEWTHGAKVGLAISASGLVAFVPALASRFPQPFWAPLTVAFVAERRVGGTLRTSMMRLQGTVLGAVAGYLLVLAFGSSPPLLVAGTAAWVMLSAYCRAHPRFAYGALVSAFTAPLVVMGHAEAEGLDAKAYAGLRIEHTVLGILVLAAVNNLIAPTRAAVAVIEDCAAAAAVAASLYRELLRAYATRRRAPAADGAQAPAPGGAIARPLSVDLQEREAALVARAHSLAADADAETLLATTMQLPAPLLRRALAASKRIAHAAFLADWALTRMLSVRHVILLGAQQQSALLDLAPPVVALCLAQQRALHLLARRVRAPSSVPSSHLDAAVTQLNDAAAGAVDAHAAFSAARRDHIYAHLRRHTTPQFNNIDILTFESFCYAMQDAVDAMRDLADACGDACVFAMDDH